MPRSLLQTFVTGTRALLAAQLIVCVGAVALAGWSLGITGEVMRERNRLQERVIQLEETMAARGDIPPPPAAVVAAAPTPQTDIAYPGSISGAAELGADATQDAIDATSTAPPRGIGSVISTLFGPAPALRTVVLHVRATSDVAAAERIASDLRAEGVRVFLNVIGDGDPRPAGYAYFDGRQSRAAADIVALFHDSARRLEIAQWSAQLRGTALPAQGEYGADRLDIVLPPLPPPPAPPLETPQTTSATPPL